MEKQTYANHKQRVIPYQWILLPVLGVTLIGAGVNLYLSIGDHQRLYSASLILVLTCCVVACSLMMRLFALKAQDRAIRAEENLRHFVLTGRLLDPHLRIRQIIALRFASDTEFPGLAQRATTESLKADPIKRAIKDWRADTYRV